MAVMFGACGDKATTPPPADTGNTSFNRIQTVILNTSCAVSGCHAGPTPTGGMSLEAGSSYANLVGITPQNATAVASGWLRVKAGDTTNSFLLHKLTGELGPDDGDRMPQGSSSLDSNKIEFIRRWIAGGAAVTGDEIDTTLLTKGGGVVPEFTPPIPPSPGEGFQLHLPGFQIPAKSEREIMWFTHAPNDAMVYVNRFRVKMRDNTHHFVLYYYPGSTLFPPTETAREINGDMDGFAAYRSFFIASQTPDFEFTFPAGVALELPANAGLDMNSHYVNGTTSEVTGEVYVNLYTVPSTQRVASILFWNNMNFTLPGNRSTTVRDTSLITQETDIFALASHTHRRGRRFRVYILGGANDGQMIYENLNWHKPPLKVFSPPLRLVAGQKLRTEAEYYNDSEFPVRFGLSSEDEMSILTGFTAPAN